MIEAMSKGTPVMASSRGSLPELVVKGTGSISESLVQLNASLHEHYDYRKVFEWAQSTFSAEAEVNGLLHKSLEIIDKVRKSKSSPNMVQKSTQ